MIISKKLPKPEQAALFLQQLQDKPFGYPEVGPSAGPMPAGYDHDFNQVYLGRGQEVFEAAKAGIQQWAMFPAGWTKVVPGAPTLSEGLEVAVFFRLFGWWWWNACRVVYTIDGPRRFGFAYGTLKGRHVECGEECFRVDMDEQGAVWYRIEAFSRPAFWLARLGYPLARRFQRRFVRDSFAAMREWVKVEALAEKN